MNRKSSSCLSSQTQTQPQQDITLSSYRQQKLPQQPNKKACEIWAVALMERSGAGSHLYFGVNYKLLRIEIGVFLFCNHARISKAEVKIFFGLQEPVVQVQLLKNCSEVYWGMSLLTWFSHWGGVGLDLKFWAFFRITVGLLNPILLNPTPRVSAPVGWY